jgi:hypothetical protein
MRTFPMSVCCLLLVCALRAGAQETAPPAPAGRFNVRDFGAVGDGKADDSAAFAKALQAAMDAGRGAVWVPAGEYRLAGQVKVEGSPAALSLLGDGQGVSCLVCDNPEGALRLHDPWCKWQVTVRGLSFLAAREGAGVALEVSSPPRGVRNYRTLLVQDVDIRGQGLPTHNYFDRGIVALNQWRPMWQNVVVSGVLDPALKSEKSDDPLQYRPACGIQADGCYAPTFQHCYVWNCRTGYQLVTENRPQGPEDCAFYRCNAVGCRVGMDIATTSIEPQLVIDSCHINCRDVGIRLARRKFFQIVNCLLYGNDGSDDQPYVDIALANCYDGLLRGNIFHSPAATNLKPEPPSQRTMITVDAACHDLLISHNLFNAKGRALWVAQGARGIVFADNRATNPLVQMPAAELDAADGQN